MLRSLSQKLQFVSPFDLLGSEPHAEQDSLILSSYFFQELFIQYLAQQGHNVVKSERKPRKVIQYKDLATAVSRIDNLEFLADVIPKTTTYKQFKEKKAKEASKDAAFEKGQRTLNGTIPSMVKANGECGHQKADKPSSISPRVPSLTLMVDRTVEAQPAENDRDVEMADQ
ncbi:hypothetical protein CNMCM5793_007407 [Aspergillus hiratsukae]|uniref:Histone-like transcription factor n=1 Tax=Aspergillus hiratsukae TaxID=1194566 RepID=A0A8H6PIS5_9EURO|nr:hypothetical protein CNMCM5793_007407 [Aspergillus hiratsukae]KAF7155476.1 hypothetical protein CNMCM6106_004622 [Aspergillus hiratsukae]